MTITWHLVPLAKRRGWENASQMALGVGITYPTAARLWNGETDRVDLVTLDKLCVAFDCQPGDLLRHESEKSGQKKR